MCPSGLQNKVRIWVAYWAVPPAPLPGFDGVPLAALLQSISASSAANLSPGPGTSEYPGRWPIVSPGSTMAPFSGLLLPSHLQVYLAVLLYLGIAWGISLPASLSPWGLCNFA